MGARGSNSGNSRAPASGGAGAAPGNTGQFATTLHQEMVVILVAVVQAQVKVMVVKPQQVEEQVVAATQDNGDKIIKQVKQVKPTQAEVREEDLQEVQVVQVLLL